jgi:transposase-like protein
MPIFTAAGGAHGTLIKVRCPHCEAVQARSRGRKRYRCSVCHRTFDAEEGTMEREGLRPRPGAHRR